NGPQAGSSSGSFGVVAGATLLFYGPQTLDSQSSVQGAGDVLFQYGTTTVSGSYAVTGSTALYAATVHFTAAVADTGVLSVDGATADFSGPASTTTAQLDGLNLDGD